MNTLTGMHGFFQSLGVNPLLGRLGLVSLELAVLAGVVALLIPLARLRTPRLRALLWLLVLAKPVLGLVIGAPWPLLLMERPAPAVQRLSGNGAGGAGGALSAAERAALLAELDRPDAAGATSSRKTPAGQGQGASVTEKHWGYRFFAWRPSLSGILFDLWLAGVAGGVLLTFIDLARLSRLCRAAAAPDEALAGRFRALAREMGIKSVPALRVSERLESPVLVGIFRPVVLLPGWLAESVTRGELDWLPRHELMHWKLNDPVALAVRRLAEILFFFHPLVWWAGRRWEEAMELACDRALLASDADARSYAEQLYFVLETRAQRRTPALRSGLCATRTQIGKRIASLLSDPLRSPARLSTLSVAGLALVALVGLLTGVGFTENKSSAAKPEAKKNVLNASEHFSSQAMIGIVSSKKTTASVTSSTASSAVNKPDSNAIKYLNLLLAQQKEEGGRDNALIHYARACMAMPPYPGDQMPLIDKTLSSGWSAASEPLRDLLKACEPAFIEFRKGAALDHARNLASALGPERPVPNFLMTNLAGKMFCVAALLEKSRGQTDGAIDNILTVLTLGRDMGTRDCTIIGGLIGIAAEKPAAIQLGRLLAEGRLPRPALERVKDRLAALDKTRGTVSDWLVSEKVCHAYWFDKLAASTPAEAEKLIAEGGPFVLLKEDLKTGNLPKVIERLRADDKRYWEFIDKMLLIPYYQRDFKTRDAEREALLVSFHPCMGQVAKNFGLNEMEIRSLLATSRFEQTRLAAALALYREAHGNYPATLNQLSAAEIDLPLPIDPFSGQSFEYHLAPGGASYSLIGADPATRRADPAAPTYDPTNGVVSVGKISLFR